MWCCSSSARFLLESIIGVQTADTLTVNGDTSASSGGSAAGITLDNGYLGTEVVLVKNGVRICGKGGALGSAPLVQTKSYFEVKVQQEGAWAVGVATRNTNLEQGPLGLDPTSWVMKSTGDLVFNDMTVGRLDQGVEEGDIIGVSFDHIELCFYVNGTKTKISFSNVRGTVYPALYVDEGAVLDVVFDSFSHSPPPGFDRIMKEKSLL